MRLGRRPALDGLRGLAVMAVIGVHLGLIAGGYVGVDVFFALSGFLITALLYEEWDRTGTIELRRFYKRRGRRLLPALLALLAGFAIVVLVLHPFAGLWPLGRLIASTLLAANNWVTALVPRHGQVLGALMPTWTLSQEVQFYLLWPLALWWLLRRRARPRAILAMLAVAMLVLFGAGALMSHAYSAYNSYTSPFDRGAELLLGCAAAIVWREGLVPAPLRWPVVGWIAAGRRGDTVVTPRFTHSSPGTGSQAGPPARRRPSLEAWPSRGLTVRRSASSCSPPRAAHRCACGSPTPLGAARCGLARRRLPLAAAARISRPALKRRSGLRAEPRC